MTPRRLRLLLLALLLHAAAGTPAAQDATVRAAGSPLRDGVLPPGMLTVRVVRGAFTNNVDAVDVQADLGAGRVERARTGADGRAQFAHLPIGARVQVTTTVDGESLVSEAFEMPAESGVRLLLVAGGDTSGHGLVAQGPAPDVQPRPSDVPAQAGPAPAAAHAPAAPPPVSDLKKTLALCAAAALAILWLLLRPRT
jgi:hypothetical protein